MHIKVKEYIENLPSFKEEIQTLRAYILTTNLTEDFKWKHPCYTDQDKNIVIIQEFKNYCALLFPKGALLTDPFKLLKKMTEDVQSDRQLRFSSLDEITTQKEIITLYIKEAIDNERKGLKVQFKSLDEFPKPFELMERFKEDSQYEEAFHALTPGRQKGYLLYFNSAKTSPTRMKRIEEHRDRIMDGKGITDCICGHSKRMPNCDGSHRFI